MGVGELGGAALGLGDSDGDGEGEGDGEACPLGAGDRDGDAVGAGRALGDADGEGLGEGLAIGLGDGSAAHASPPAIALNAIDRAHAHARRCGLPFTTTRSCTDPLGERRHALGTNERPAAR